MFLHSGQKILNEGEICFLYLIAEIAKEMSKRHLKSYRDENGEDVAVKKGLPTCSYTYYPSAFILSGPVLQPQNDSHIFTYKSEKVVYD